MSSVAVHLLGRFWVRRGADSAITLEGAKVQELFAFLLLQRGRSCRREAVAEVLWGEATPLQARKYFRQALWQVQAALGEGSGVAADSRTLLVEPDWVSLNPAASVWLEMDVLESAAEQSQGVPGRLLTPETAGVLREVVDDRLLIDYRVGLQVGRNGVPQERNVLVDDEQRVVRARVRRSVHLAP